MRKLVFLDIETRSTRDLKKCGSWAYAEDCEVIMIQMAEGTGEVDLYHIANTNGRSIRAGIDRLRAIADKPDKYRVIVHNGLGFDLPVLSIQHGIDFPLSMIVDTMNLARLHGYPRASLGHLSEQLGITKTGFGKLSGGSFIDVFCKPRADGSFISPQEQPDAWSKGLEYARYDILALREVYKRLPRINRSEWESKLEKLDAEINRIGFRVDINWVRKFQKLIDLVHKTTCDKVMELSNGVITTTRQYQRIQSWLEGYGIMMSSLSAAAIDAALDDDSIIGEPREMLELLAGANLSSVAKYQRLLDTVSSDGRLRGTLLYRGASQTGRWSGRLFQPQNLPSRGVLSADEVDTLLNSSELPDSSASQDINAMMLAAKSALRAMILPNDGEHILIADYASIESRVQAYIANEAWKLDAFRAYDAGTGPDLYKLAYARAFNIDPKDVTSMQRTIGKVMELALGYGGGIGAFCTMAKNYKLDLSDVAKLVVLDAETRERAQYMAAKFTSLPIDVAVACEGLKLLWRSRHPSIVAKWKEYEDTFSNQDASAPYRTMPMCSGRMLFYHDVQSGPTGYTHLTKDGRKSIYGGKLFQHQCQALAADILADRALALASNYDTLQAQLLLTVHDEFVASIPKHVDISNVLKALTTSPDFTQGLPLAVEHTIASRYRK